jgi:hypothetical protein
VYSSQDKVQAHRFNLRRIRSALIAGDPDVYEAPLSRATTALVAGLAVAMLALLAIFIYHKVTGR